MRHPHRTPILQIARGVCTDVDNILNQIPKEYSISQNYPNPFNPATVIRYGLPEQSAVKLEVYDILGQSVAVLVNQIQEARYYEVHWKAEVPSGIYFYRIMAHATANPDRRLEQVKKMILVR